MRTKIGAMKKKLFRSAALLCGFVSVFLLLGRGTPLRGAEFTIRADWFDRGNLLSGGGYSDRYTCVFHQQGETSDFAQYDVSFPADGSYAISILVAAQESRPVNFGIDDDLVVRNVLGEVTGSWQTSTAQWRPVVQCRLSAGLHTLKISRDECIPHICAIKIEPLFDAPAWDLPRPRAKEKAIVDGVEHERPFPWNVGWYDEISRDRRKKGESGGVFADHFASETAVALAPKEDYRLETLSGPASEGEFLPDIQDELTYTASMFLEEEPKAEPAQLAVRLVRVSPDADASLVDGSIFVLSEARYRLLIEKTKKLLDDFNERFSPEELADAGLSEEMASKIEEALRAGEERLASLEELLRSDDSAGKEAFAAEFFDLVRLYSEAARKNPLLAEFDRLICVERHAGNLGLPQNWQSNSALDVNGFDDSLVLMTLRGDGADAEDYPASRLLFHPNYPTFLGDLDLHFDADRLLFSATQKEDRAWNLFELNLNDLQSMTAEETTARTAELMLPQIPPMPEANHYDGCYLADGSLIFTSTAVYAAVPCVNGWDRITNTFRKYPDGSIRRLTFDQEHNWCPTVMADGRILYQRWEYTDSPHVPTRLLFQMNPDGTNQRAFYGSNSYWPNAMFYARPIPGDPAKFVAIIGGHHGVTRMGEMVLFDTALGHKQTDGAVMRICGKEKKVAPKTNPKYDDTLIVDNLVDEAWPKFLHPYPLSENYYLVAAQPYQGGLWGIYLVDTEDNMTLLAQKPGFALLEPTPILQTEKPPVPADRVDTSREDASVFIADVYEGPGLKDVPRGTIKQLRLISYEYLFPKMGGPQGVVGADGPWDIKRILGTVPVESSGAALFQVPANTPFAVQPLDENGKAVQLMRSWMTAMPGETLSCIGCHEEENSISPASFNPDDMAKLSTKTITPWRGQARGFSFPREVQPVLDRYCVGCHDGEKTAPGNPECRLADLRGDKRIDDYSSSYHYGTNAGRFSISYTELHRYVRRPGLESDYHLQKPAEFSAETTDLYQMLAGGHYGVQLDAESWDRLITWIDLNAPYYGTWNEQAETPDVDHWNARRQEIQALYAGVVNDEEAIHPTDYSPDKALPDSAQLAEKMAPAAMPSFPDWTFDSEEARQRQAAAARELFGDPAMTEKRVELADGVSLLLKLIPAGEYVAGAQSPDANGSLLIRAESEKPRVVKIEKPFWLGALEITNRQYELFDPAHDSGVESRTAMQFGVRGFYVNAPELPVVRVSWNEAQRFCQWLSEKTGESFRLPTADEAQWAARAGTGTPFWYGTLESDFSAFENLCDVTTRDFICHPYFKEIKPLGGTKYDQYLPKDERFNDHALLSAQPGKYRPNPWGLYDVHGNVSEWSATDAMMEMPGRGGEKIPGKIVTGGSWRDRPINARSESQAVYRPWQGVYDVGFRVAVDAGSPGGR